jgi:hypothetical protein
MGCFTHPSLAESSRAALLNLSPVGDYYFSWGKLEARLVCTLDPATSEVSFSEDGQSGCAPIDRHGTGINHENAVGRTEVCRTWRRVSIALTSHEKREQREGKPHNFCSHIPQKAYPGAGGNRDQSVGRGGLLAEECLSGE